MKKVLFSLLLAFAFIPVTFGQSAGNAKEYSMVTKDTTICSSFTWIDGHEYSTTTTASCVKDSIVYVLHITKLEPTYDTLVAKPVEGRCFVTFNNEIYDTPGIQLVTMSAANGCDSVVKIDLSFTNHDTISVTGEACSEYPLSFGNWKDTVRATTVGESNVMIGACELHRILNITIFPAYTDSNNVSEVTAGCQYTWEGITITDTNVAHYKMLSSIHGCDSLAAVKVVSYNGIQEDTAIVNACDRYVFAPGDTLYTVNSGGLDNPNYDSTVSVVDLVTFTEVRKINVGMNPTKIVKIDNNRLMVVCNGNYGSVPSSLAVIDLGVERVTRMPFTCTNLTVAGNYAYCYDFDWSAMTAVFYRVNLCTLAKESFTLNGSDGIVCPYGIAVNKDNGNIYLTDSQNFISSGDFYCFSSAGAKLYKCGCGMGPSKVVMW